MTSQNGPVDGRRPLTDAEESELLRGFQGGSREPLDQLIDAHMHRVTGIAEEFLDQGLGHRDLLAEGTMGLISAARHFDETRFSSFARFAEDRIRGTIVRAIGEMGGSAPLESERG